MSDPVDHETDVDDFDSYLGAETGSDFDINDSDEAEFPASTRRPAMQAAWQRLDERNVDRWLREQMSDWDDYDDEPRMH